MLDFIILGPQKFGAPKIWAQHFRDRIRRAPWDVVPNARSWHGRLVFAHGSSGPRSSENHWGSQFTLLGVPIYPDGLLETANVLIQVDLGIHGFLQTI